MTHQLAVGEHHEILAVVSHHTTQAGEFLSAHRGYRITFSHQIYSTDYRLKALAMRAQEETGSQHMRLVFCCRFAIVHDI